MSGLIAILVSLIGALAALAAGKDVSKARSVALLAALIGAVASAFCFWSYDPLIAGVQQRVAWDWMPSIGIGLTFGVDGISCGLILLTGLIAVTGILFSWNIEDEPGAYYAQFLLLIAGCYGVFLSRDLFALFFFYEMAILPKFFLIAGWGGEGRRYAAMKLALFSLVSSAAVLFGIVALAASVPGSSFLFEKLVGVPVGVQSWIFPLLFLGFGTLAGLWPLHTWVPTGHTAAPTGGSILLAGLVMKLGGYGVLRVAYGLCPQGAMEWSPWVLALGAVGVVYGACMALGQRDAKFLVASSSVSHMAFVIVGLGSLTALGVAGAVVQMISHGLVAALLFAIVGRVIYDRLHLRMLGGFDRLHEAMPVAAGVFLIAALASMGMPGMSGFVAEIQILLGAWQAGHLWVVAALVIGVVLTAAYMLRALHGLFLCKRPDVAEVQKAGLGQPLTKPELIGMAILIAAIFWIGLAPGALHERVYASVNPFIEPWKSSPSAEGGR